MFVAVRFIFSRSTPDDAVLGSHVVGAGPRPVAAKISIGSVECHAPNGGVVHTSGVSVEAHVPLIFDTKSMMSVASTEAHVPACPGVPVIDIVSAASVGPIVPVHTGAGPTTRASVIMTHCDGLALICGCTLVCADV